MIPGPTSTVGDVPDYQHWHIGHGPGLTESVGACSKRLLRIDEAASSDWNINSEGTHTLKGANKAPSGRQATMLPRGP